jgi:hypothetical protein
MGDLENIRPKLDVRKIDLIHRASETSIKNSQPNLALLMARDQIHRQGISIVESKRQQDDWPDLIDEVVDF